VETEVQVRMSIAKAAGEEKEAKRTYFLPG
jgi:hypothetical protein